MSRQAQAQRRLEHGAFVAAGHLADHQLVLGQAAQRRAQGVRLVGYRPASSRLAIEQDHRRLGDIDAHHTVQALDGAASGSHARSPGFGLSAGAPPGQPIQVSKQDEVGSIAGPR